MVRGIVLVVIDCLRADHVSCYGYGRPTTPTIDSLAEHGLTWRNAHSTSSWTKPSVASLLTGLYPCQHGVLRGVKRSKGRVGITTDALVGESPTMAEVLSNSGWRCAAFLNNVQCEEYTGFNRGFGTYVPIGGKADRLLEMLNAWLGENANVPFFVYLHFLESHWPYKPRRRHVQMFGGDRDTNMFRDYSARDYARLRRALSRGETTLPGEQFDEMVRMYDGAVRRLDGKVKVLLQILRERGAWNETALAVTADHGEEFLEHGTIGHGHSLYDELTHVPLMVRWPGGPMNELRDHPVSLVDLPRTLLSIAGLRAEFPGCDLVVEAQEPSSVCSELSIRNRYTQTLRVGSWKLHHRTVFDAGVDAKPLELLRRARTGVLAHHETAELFDLSTDPGERFNLAAGGKQAETVSRLTDQLRRWWSGLQGGPSEEPGGEVQVDEAVIQRLRALGYIE